MNQPAQDGNGIQKKRLSKKQIALTVLGVFVAIIIIWSIVHAIQGGGSTTNSSTTSTTSTVSTPAPASLVSSSGVPDNDAIKAALAKAMDYNGSTVRFSGSIESVTSNGDASTAGNYWVVVNAYNDTSHTFDADTYLSDNVQAAAALAHILSAYPSIQKVVWNGDCTNTSGSKVTAMQVIYTTKDVPASLNSNTSIMIQRAESYNLKDVVYNSLSKYKSIPQKKSA